VSASGRKFLLVDVATGPEARTYFNGGMDCPADPSALGGLVHLRLVEEPSGCRPTNRPWPLGM